MLLLVLYSFRKPGGLAQNLIQGTEIPGQLPPTLVRAQNIIALWPVHLGRKLGNKVFEWQYSSYVKLNQHCIFLPQTECRPGDQHLLSVVPSLVPSPLLPFLIDRKMSSYTILIPLSTKTRSAETPIKCCHRLFRMLKHPIVVIAFYDGR